ncbi:Predicted PurR-regulated permease PerM [Peptostreptococcus russellii]|uniref:Predicted PurR-regulated permease PerM n=1 Tax=Peptostreptococcus russellii TaxID=215200 RepID=A0A1H8GP33_9FIRM|nr:AI-2E family transporter [Peptostreptococcus russellii]SEN45772.1 Predicted PurR-regulated permease PerM [Peptostreptococcus russellii]
MENRFKTKQNVYLILIVLGIVLAVALNAKDVLIKFFGFLGIFKPIFLGCVIAFILNIVVSLWEKIFFPNTKSKYLQKSRRGICILLSFLSVILILYLVYMLVVPQLSKSIAVISNKFPDLYESIRDEAIKHSSSLPTIREKLLSSDKTGQEAIQKLIGTLSIWTSNIFNIIGSVFGVMADFVMSTIIAIYLVAGKETLGRQFKKLFKRFLPEGFTKKMYYVLDIANSTFASFFTGQFIEAIILGSLCTVGLFIFRFPYAPMIGSVVGFTALIPLIGAYIGGAFGFFMILTHSPIQAILFIVFLVILQQIEGNLIYPRVVGGSVGLPGVWVIIAIIIGGGLAGIAGVFFSVPVTATIYKILKAAVNDGGEPISKDFLSSHGKISADIKISIDEEETISESEDKSYDYDTSNNNIEK